ncbi:MAG: hypothetical protein M3326_06545 [Actinomycetota bacterium]|nr:hypothetical protein [Actinomycetota bacterium]
MASTRTFPFRYGFFRPLLSVFGMGPAFSRVDIDGDTLRVRMGWWFSADVPLGSIKDPRPHKGMVGGIGVHGGRGWWLVNGAAKDIVTMDVEPRAQARVMGVPVKLRKLEVSVKSPDELIAALKR